MAKRRNNRNQGTRYEVTAPVFTPVQTTTGLPVVTTPPALISLPPEGAANLNGVAVTRLPALAGQTVYFVDPKSTRLAWISRTDGSFNTTAEGDIAFGKTPRTPAQLADRQPVAANSTPMQSIAAWTPAPPAPIASPEVRVAVANLVAAVITAGMTGAALLVELDAALRAANNR
jgi:hypothetical protein